MLWDSKKKGVVIARVAPNDFYMLKVLSPPSEHFDWYPWSCCSVHPERRNAVYKSIIIEIEIKRPPPFPSSSRQLFFFCFGMFIHIFSDHFWTFTHISIFIGSRLLCLVAVVVFFLLVCCATTINNKQRNICHRALYLAPTLLFFYPTDRPTERTNELKTNNNKTSRLCCCWKISPPEAGASARACITMQLSRARVI